MLSTRLVVSNNNLKLKIISGLKKETEVKSKVYTKTLGKLTHILSQLTSKNNSSVLNTKKYRY